MNIEEGSRRLSKGLTGILAICVWIPIFTAFMIYGIMQGGDAGNALLAFVAPFIFLLIVTYIIKEIFHNLITLSLFFGIGNVDNIFVLIICGQTKCLLAFRECLYFCILKTISN